MPTARISCSKGRNASGAPNDDDAGGTGGAIGACASVTTVAGATTGTPTA